MGCHKSPQNVATETAIILYLFARAGVTKYHELRGLNNRSVLAHSSAGWESKKRGWAGWVPAEAVTEAVFQASPGCWWIARDLLCSLACRSTAAVPAFTSTRPSPCHPRVRFSLSSRDTSHTGLELALMTSLCLDYFYENPISGEGRTLSRWGLGLQVPFEGEHKCISRISLWSDPQLTVPVGSPVGLLWGYRQMWGQRRGWHGPRALHGLSTWAGLGFLTAWPPGVRSKHPSEQQRSHFTAS